ncbi:ParA family protein [Vibrio parahaemolyticus]|uniref:ParA family protein n=2 Tax=Vibrio parahaemolyticus TaxID=670 RepID=UPI00041B24C9|nr:ParA family protein [Vibrio parahaemolyticus]ELN6894061.1 ParA family protein [Vibrio cholerae]EIK4811107.1 ParA family protein [Vibrio parahaemolyticus]EKC5524110.1 ParA family protein [Vibrio parahaemolyticus]MBM4959687.1 ParA family protein [Vibrio parahaemolyticus]MBM5096298.1 ParA family protein [Vibrio parahaemolyticus]
MIISFLSQKGGVTKSTLARAVSVAFAENGWSVHLADMDWQQQTCGKWSARRDDKKIIPSISASSHRRVDSALKNENAYDLLVIDGKPAADQDSIIIAKNSSLVVLPTGTSLDDLEPQLNLANDFKMNGISNNQILFVVNKATTEIEAINAIETIRAWGFPVCSNVIPFKAGYSSAQDLGLSVTETRFPSLNTLTNKVIQEIVDLMI